MSKPVNLFVQMDVDLGEHFKVMRATTKLNSDVRTRSSCRHADCTCMSVNEENVIGYMFNIWSWTLRFDPERGSLGRLTEAEIARLAHYPGDSAVFVKTMIEEEFLSPDLVIHGWDDVYGPLNARRKSNKESQRRSRKRQRDKGDTSAPRGEKSKEEKSRVGDPDDPEA